MKLALCGYSILIASIGTILKKNPADTHPQTTISHDNQNNKQAQIGIVFELLIRPAYR
jgi:hypothetical protein